MENTCISKMGRKSYTYLKIEDKGALRKIVLNNPSKNNSLNTQAYQELTGNGKIIRKNRSIFNQISLKNDA